MSRTPVDNTAMSTDRPPIRRADVLLALGVAGVQGTLVVLAGAVLDESVKTALPAAATLLVLEGLFLVLWRFRPLVCQATVWTAEILLILVLPRDNLFYGVGQFFVAFGVGTRMPLRRAVPLLGTLGSVYAALLIWKSGDPSWQLDVNTFIGVLIRYLLPLLGGFAVASSRRYERSRQEFLQREHGRQLEMALVQECRRLAGELHDVAAHHIAGIVVQAAAIERLVDSDPDTAKTAAAQLRGQAKEALAGLRSVVGLLRRDHEDGAGAPDSGTSPNSSPPCANSASTSAYKRTDDRPRTWTPRPTPPPTGSPSRPSATPFSTPRAPGYWWRWSAPPRTWNCPSSTDRRSSTPSNPRAGTPGSRSCGSGSPRSTAASGRARPRRAAGEYGCPCP